MLGFKLKHVSERGAKGHFHVLRAHNWNFCENKDYSIFYTNAPTTCHKNLFTLILILMFQTGHIMNMS